MKKKDENNNRSYYWKGEIMSEHIKTGAEIWNDLETAKSDEDLKWISLSWLKEQINKKNWCKIFDGIAWDYDDGDQSIFGFDTYMNSRVINEELSEKLLTLLEE